MFNLDFMNNLWQAHGDHPWPTKLMNYNHKTCVLNQVKYLLDMNHLKQYALTETSWKKWPKNASDLEDNEYELLGLKYDANEDALVAKKKGNRVEEKSKKTKLSTLKSKYGKKQKAQRKIIVGHATKSLSNHDIEKRCGHYHMSMIVGTNRNEDCDQGKMLISHYL